MDADIKELIQLMLEEQRNTWRAVSALAESVDMYVAASDARLKRMEESMDNLIKIIALEHTNGEGR
jgi:hypothetical protein